MTRRSTSTEPLGADERRFIDQLDRGYAPEPMTGARRTAFDARLRERLQERSRTRLWFPGLVASGCAALLAWALLGTPEELAPSDTFQGGDSFAQNDAPALSSWEEELWQEELAWLPTSELRGVRTAGDDSDLSPDDLNVEPFADRAIDLFEGEGDEDLLSSEYAAIDDLFLDYVDGSEG